MSESGPEPPPVSVSGSPQQTDHVESLVPTGSSPGSAAALLLRPPLKSMDSSRVDGSAPGVAYDGLHRAVSSEDPSRPFVGTGSSLRYPSTLPSLITPVESGKMSSSSWLIQNSYDKSDRSKGSKTIKSPPLLQSILEREILLCPLDRVPGKEVKRYLGPLQLHFVKDAWTGRGDQSSDTYSFIEVASMNAMAHVSSLGGNALLCYKLVMQEPAHKLSSRSHSYTLVTVTGDVVSLSEISPSPLGSPAGGLSRQSSVGIEMESIPRRTSRIASSTSMSTGVSQTRDRNTSGGSNASMSIAGMALDGDSKTSLPLQPADASDFGIAFPTAHSPSSSRNK